MVTTIVATFLYGAGIHANLTQGLPATLGLYIDILIVTLQLFLSTVVGGCALFHDVEDKLGVPRGESSGENTFQLCLAKNHGDFLIF